MKFKNNFDKRMLFPTTYWHWKKRGDFNAFLFWVDLCLWAISISIGGVALFLNFI